MTSALLSGLAALIMGSIGALASTADAFSSVVTRRFNPAPIRGLANEIPRPILAQDAGAPPAAPAPSAGGGGGGSSASPPPSSGEGGVGGGGSFAAPPPSSGSGGGEGGGMRGPEMRRPSSEGQSGGTGGSEGGRMMSPGPADSAGREPGRFGGERREPEPRMERREPARPVEPRPSREVGPRIGSEEGQPGSDSGRGERRGPEGQPGEMRGGEPGLMPRGEGERRGGEGPGGDQGRGMMRGQEGPSEEEMQAQEEERQKRDEARQKEMEAKQLAQMKRGMKRAAAELNRMKGQFGKYAAKGFTVSSECSDALDKAQTMVDAVMNAETFEAVQEIEMNDLGDYFDTLNECRQTLDRLSRLPQMLKRVDGQIKQMERNWTRAKQGAPEAAQDAIAEGDKVLADIKAARAKLEEQMKGGELDDFEATLEDEIFGKFDDLGAAMQQIEAAKNAKRFVAQFTRNLKDAERMIAKLKKRGEDTSKLEELLARAKALYAQIKDLKVGSDEWLQAVEDLANLGQDFAEATGGTEDVGGMIGPPSGGGPQLRLEGIQRTGPSGGGGGGPSLAP